MNITEVKVGGDPEFFVMDAERKLVSSRGLYGGTKDDPVQLEYGGVQEDNIMLELNIVPATTPAELRANISNLLQEIHSNLVEHGRRLSHVSSVDVRDLGMLPELMEFGCEPDYNAWTGDRNPPPDLANNIFRFAGGHIHCSVNQELTWEQQRNIVKWFDYAVGTYCVIHDVAGEERMKVYGTPGRFRPTKYKKGVTGVEYRVPSNWWCTRQQSATIFSLSKFAMLRGVEREFNELNVGVHPELISAAISDRNADLATFIRHTTGIARKVQEVQ